jgi:hypothetical protein
MLWKSKFSAEKVSKNHFPKKLRGKFHGIRFSAGKIVRKIGHRFETASLTFNEMGMTSPSRAQN